ncbi:putative leucine-rich repeat protein [Tanacetum coccineum]|uniref:Leucine-rich repeat protein n=1 Tax=Tanacetum coccineum TaxID=301880 RepID=A0ABQ5IUV4_9ASTR
MRMRCSTGPNDEGACEVLARLQSEKQALLQFKHSLVDEANRPASWVSEESDCCKWVGIDCDNITGHVHRIHLPGANGHCHGPYSRNREYEEASRQRLRGDLSSSLLNLKQLRHLDLSCNDFGGIHIPSFISSLKNLRYLNLSKSEFGGIIPAQLGNLSELHVLCLGSFYEQLELTSMTPVITIELTRMSNMHWLSSLRMMHHLDLSGVDLSKAIDWLQVINTLPRLSHEHLSDDKLPRFLQASGNDFMNSLLVLKELFSVGSNLNFLDINSCGISSSVLDSLHNLTSLLSLDMSENQLTTATPKCKNSPSLESLSISSSGLSGHVPYQLGQLSFLGSLYLGKNLIYGPIWHSVGRLSSLEALDLSRNQLNGSMEWIRKLISLEVLDLLV